MTDGSSLNQSALPAKNIGFFNKFRIVLMNRPAMEGPLSVNLEQSCIHLIIR